jgi:hypothetical protein
MLVGWIGAYSLLSPLVRHSGPSGSHPSLRNGNNFHRMLRPGQGGACRVCRLFTIERIDASTKHVASLSLSKRFRLETLLEEQTTVILHLILWSQQFCNFSGKG